MKGFGNMMKQAQQIQAKIAEVQEDLGKKRVEATAGGGMVTVVADGQQNIIEMKIDPEVVDPEDIEMLQDLLVAAVNEARRKAQELAAEEMRKLTGGLSIPGLF
jgi:DNA-binding YbaB/EbfC family protein